MAKKRSQYVCQSCGRITAAYMGRCPQCGEFDTMVEEVIVAETAVATKNPRAHTSLSSKPQRLADVTADGFERLSLPLSEFARVLGGGIVPGSLVLVGGDPGIGKSTLLLEVAGMVANQHGATLYVSGEESSRQIKMRAERLQLTAHDLYLV
ncbi:MAG TPA: AAA family ATPase, partial [Chloroflexota bacterium]|nr:AAA family ATPase [Chloroflexota bacterium]